MESSENKFGKIETLKQMLEINSKRYAIRKAFLFQNSKGEDEHITYKAFYNQTRQLAAALFDLLGENKKIAVCMKNCFEWCISYLAVCSGAGIVVPLEREIVFDEFVNIINFAKIDAVIADEKIAAILLKNHEQLPENFKIISTGSVNDERIVSYSSMLEKGKALIKKDNNISKSEIDPEAPAVLLFTSGTTGTAKAVMLSNKNLCSDMMGICNVIDVSRDDSTLCILPLHHTYQAIVMLTVLYIGGRISFSENLRHVAQDMQHYKPTVLACVPLLLEKTHAKIIKKLNEQTPLKKSITVGKVSQVFAKISGSEMKKRLYSSIHEAFGGNLRLIITGAAAINEELVKDYEAFGIPVIIGYGLTECSPIAICNNSQNPRPDGIGKPISGAQAKIENPTEDGIGEICIKGPMVMLGYYNNKKATDETIIDGWLHTGDLGFCDEEMNYHITGRSKNVIIAKNGKNVYPEELEYYLNREPVVLESLIFSDNEGDEQVTACVVPDEEAIKTELQKEKLTKEDIQSAIANVVKKINRALPSYKSIKKVRIREDELEKTKTSKIKRSSRKNKDKINEISNDHLQESGEQNES